MNAKILDDIKKLSLDDRLDEALDESFPASDPPAVHPHYAVRGDESSRFPPGGKDAADAQIDFEQGAIRVDAALVAEDLNITPALVMAGIREGKITSRCERGVGDDAGRFRLTFFYANRVVRLIVDEKSAILERSSAIA
ncbi:MAG: DUF6522 family protein [Steroidobacteraceae bacterium]